MLSSLATNLAFALERHPSRAVQLSGTLGSWDLGGKPLHELARARGARAASDDGLGRLARPVVRFEGEGGSGDAEEGGLPSLAVVGVRTGGLGAWLCCCCRTGEAAVRLALMGAACRCCSLYLPLVRLAAILCCCLRPVRNLLALAMPFVCEAACCCCPTSCFRLMAWCCQPRPKKFGHRPPRRPGDHDAEELPSVELLGITSVRT